MSERILALLLRTPVYLSNNLPSNFGDIDRTSPALALGILQALGDVDLGSEKSGLDQEVSLESGVHDSRSGGVGRQPNETKGRIDGGIREPDVERGIAGEGIDREFATRKVFSGGEEGDVTMDRAVRGLDEDLGEISKFIPFVTGLFLLGVVRKGDVDGDGSVPGFENQELSGGEVSNDGIILGSEMTTINAQSLRILMVSQICHVITRMNFEPLL